MMARISVCMRHAACKSTCREQGKAWLLLSTIWSERQASTVGSRFIAVMLSFLPGKALELDGRPLIGEGWKEARLQCRPTLIPRFVRDTDRCIQLA